MSADEHAHRPPPPAVGIDIPLDDELTPIHNPRWTGNVVDWQEAGEDPALDRATPEVVRGALVHRATGAPGARATQQLARAPRTRRAARHCRAGAADLYRAAHQWCTAHEDQWMLDQYRTDGKHYPNAEKYLADRARQRAELAGRRRIVALSCTAAIAIGLLLAVVGLLLSFWALALLLAAGASGTGAAGWRGAGAARRATGAPLARAPGESGARAGAPAGAVHLSTGAITDALHHAGFLKDDRAIEVSHPRPMPGGNGWSCVVTLPLNLPALSVIKKRHEMATALDTVDRCLILLPDRTSNRKLYLWKCDHPPLAGPPTPSPIIEAKQVDVWKPIPFGLTPDGKPILLKLIGERYLITGEPGAGKSFAARLLAAAVALDPHARSIFMDPDRSGTWRPFGARGEYFEGATPEALEAMVARLEEIAEHEFDRLADAAAAYSRRHPLGVTESKLTRDMAHDATDDKRPLFIFLEECHQFIVAGGEIKRRFIAACQTIATRGRKWGISLVFLTQYASDANLPVEIRNILTTRISLKQPTEGACRIALGDLFDGSGMDPMAFDISDEGGEHGALYLVGSGKAAPAGPWALGRADFMNDPEAVAVIARGAALALAVRPPASSATEGHACEHVNQQGAGPVELLARLVATFRDAEDALTSGIIIARLQADHPGEHDTLTIRGMNTWLRPLGLRTEKVSRENHKGLRLRTVEHALIRERDRARDGTAAAPEPRPTEDGRASGAPRARPEARPETAPDQDVRRSGTRGPVVPGPWPGSPDPGVDRPLTED